MACNCSRKKWHETLFAYYFKCVLGLKYRKLENWILIKRANRSAMTEYSVALCHNKINETDSLVFFHNAGSFFFRKTGKKTCHCRISALITTPTSSPLSTSSYHGAAKALKFIVHPINKMSDDLLRTPKLKNFDILTPLIVGCRLFC